MINQEVKGTLAKLLATENLTVEHRKVSTAYFDVDKRVLCLPIWKKASNTVYDLLVGHEVGHALYTPQEDFPGVSKAFVNVLEDARIERMMKREYPGLRKSFFEGYKELWDDDFFGVKGDDYDTLSLIDRVNLYFKGNPSIPFTDEEMIWVNRAANTKTFKDVVDLAREMWDHANQKQEEKEEMMTAPQSGGNSGQQSDEQQVVTPDEKEGRGENESNDDSQSEQQSESDDADLDTPSYGGDVDETVSRTEQALADALEDLVDDNAKEWAYLSIPDVDIDEVIVTESKIREDLRFNFYGRAFSDQVENDHYFKVLDKCISYYEKYKKDAQKSVNYLCKQFEMKKSADEYKRAATSKTGVIDTNKLHKYKLTEDIFKKVTVIPEGKNHGLVMYLDWSGSMADVMSDTLKQTMNLVWFCKKSGIPFRVYAFQAGIGRMTNESNAAVTEKLNDLCVHEDFSMLELFSSRQSKAALDESMKLIWLQVQAMCHNWYTLRGHYKYGLGGTPLAEAVYCVRNLVDRLKRAEKVSKVNVVCLTDGESNPISYLRENKYDYSDREFSPAYMCHARGTVFILRDPITGYQRKIDSNPIKTTREIISFYQEITDFNWIGIRLCTKSEMTRLVREERYDMIEKTDKQWRKERFASIKGLMGFTEMFFMPNQYIGQGTLDLEVKQKKEVATKAELTRAFRKHMGSKMANKTVLNAFIDHIA